MKKHFIILAVMLAVSACATLPTATVFSDQENVPVIVEYLSRDIADAMRSLYPPAYTNICFSKTNLPPELHNGIIDTLRLSGYAISENEIKIESKKNNITVTNAILDEVQKSESVIVYRISLYMDGVTIKTRVLSRLYLCSREDGMMSVYGEWSLQM